MYDNSCFEENISQLSELQIVLSTVLNIVDKDTDSIWSKIYRNELPPAFSTNYEIPKFYRICDKSILDESYIFFEQNKTIPISYFMCGQYIENVINKGIIDANALKSYQTGADMNEPFCIIKLCEYLIKNDEINSRMRIINLLLRSFIMTGIEPYKYLNQNIYYEINGFSNLDSFWYLCYYYDVYTEEFLISLNEFFDKENLNNKLKDAFTFLFNSLHDNNEQINVLNRFEELAVKYSDNVSALHFCMLTFYLAKFRQINVNFEFLLGILKFLADSDNPYACEKLALILDTKKNYNVSFQYFIKSSLLLFPTSLLYIGNYYCSVRNPNKKIELDKSIIFWRYASYFGLCNSIEYLKLLEVKKDYYRLFKLAEYSYNCSLFGIELILGECYEKGRGTEKNHKQALSFYKNGLKKHSEGCGFLYRIARTYEKLNNSKCQDFYKVCFSLYNKLYEKDKNNSNNMWILDAYRISSMYAVGRGVKKDVNKSSLYIDNILLANINEETSSFLCIFYVTLAFKRDLIHNVLNYSSLLSVDEMNNQKIKSKQSYNDNKTREEFNEIVKISDSKRSASENLEHDVISNIYFELKNSYDIFEAEVIENINKLYSKKNSKKANIELILIQGFIENIKKCGGRVINVNDINIDELIANGKINKVFSGLFNNQRYAIKEFISINEKTVKSIFEEISIQISLKDLKINKVLFLALGINPLRICSINKYVKYNLRYVINNICLNTIQKLLITKQLAEGLCFLHSQTPAIIHRDIKPENILMNEDFNIELCDFGGCNIEMIDNNEKNYTLRYAAPELIKNGKISKAIDIWSFGLVTYEIFLNKQAWLGYSHDQIMDCLKKEKIPFNKSYENFDEIPVEVKNLIKKSLSCDYRNRPTINEILEDIISIIYDLNII